MPSIIVFGTATGASNDKGRSAETLRVLDDAETVVRKFAQSKTGFVNFDVKGGRTTRTVWVNRHQIRMVREVKG
jgi:hypothetical protein